MISPRFSPLLYPPTLTLTTIQSHPLGFTDRESGHRTQHCIVHSIEEETITEPRSLHPDIRNQWNEQLENMTLSLGINSTEIPTDLESYSRAP